MISRPVALVLLALVLSASEPQKPKAPTPFASIGSPSVRTTPTEGPGIVLTFFPQWEEGNARPETAWRRWVSAVGLAHNAAAFPGETTVTLVPMGNGDTTLHLQWRDFTIPGPEFDPIWPTLLGPPRIPSDWIHLWEQFHAQWPDRLMSLLPEDRAVFIFLQALDGLKGPHQVMAPPVKSGLERNALRPVDSIEVQAPTSILSQPKAFPHLVPPSPPMGVLGGIYSDFAGGYVGGFPTRLGVDVVLVKAPSGPASAVVPLPRVYSQKWQGGDVTLPPATIIQTIADTHLALGGEMGPEPLRHPRSITLAPRLVLQVKLPVLTLVDTPDRPLPEVMARLLMAMAELYLGQLSPDAATALRRKTQLPEGASWPAGDLNAAFCSWKGGYGFDFSSSWFGHSDRLRLFVLSPDPMGTLQGITRSLLQRRGEGNVTLTPSQVVSWKAFLSEEPLPRFSNLPVPKDTP